MAKDYSIAQHKIMFGQTHLHSHIIVKYNQFVLFSFFDGYVLFNKTINTSSNYIFNIMRSFDDIHHKLTNSNIKMPKILD